MGKKILLSFLAVVFVSFVSIYTIGFASEEGGKTAAGKPCKTIPDIKLGSAQAPVKIVEYSSFGCHYCAKFHEVVVPKLKSYIDKGKVQIIMRPYPLSMPALAGAMVLTKVPKDEQPKIIETLFEKQGDWMNDVEEGLSQICHISTTEIKECMGNEELQKSVLMKRLEAEKERGIDATPTFVINDKKYVGYMTFDEFKAIIDPLLK